MRRINSLAELKLEQKRLKSRRVFLEQEIKKDFKEMKEEITPINMLHLGAKKTLLNENSALLGSSVGLLAKLITRKALKNSGFLSRIIVPLLIKNVSSNLVEKNKFKIASWIGEVVSKLKDKKTISGSSEVKDQR
jgi:hypothetical protein